MLPGRIKWCRCLRKNLAEQIDQVSAHVILKTLPATSDLLRKYTSVKTTLETYENDMKALWINQNVSIISKSWNC